MADPEKKLEQALKQFNHRSNTFSHFLMLQSKTDVLLRRSLVTKDWQ